MADSPEVRLDVADGVATLTIDRPAVRNALSGAVIGQLLGHLDALDRDPAVRALVVTGAGDRIFCAGGDLSSMGDADGMLAAHDERARYGQLLLKLSQVGKPSIARVNGHAMAGGLGLMMACDLAVAADDAQFGTPEVDRGLFPMMVVALLQRHLGRKRALELVLTGARFDAKTALDWGLLNRAVPRAALDATVTQLAQQLASKSPAILKLGRRAFFAAEDLAFGQALEHLASQLSLNLLAEDAAEGVTAYLEKRPPQWKNK
jgi:enoyl-CoA hydratase/carnithine racemase